MLLDSGTDDIKLAHAVSKHIKSLQQFSIGNARQ